MRGKEKKEKGRKEEREKRGRRKKYGPLPVRFNIATLFVDATVN